MSQPSTSASFSGITHKGPPPPPPPKKEGLRHWVQEYVGKAIVQPDGTEPNSPRLGDQRRSHLRSRDGTTEHPSEHGVTGSLSTAGVGVEPVVLTGVGRANMNQGVMRVVDEARWNLEPQPDTNHGFALVLSMFGDKNNLLIKSPFLVSLFEDVTKRTGMMGMTKGSEGISFLEPYVPLYWCYSEIIQSGANAENPSQQDIQDLQSLRYWYEKWALSMHDKIRETTYSGFIAFEDIWALFRPGEMVYSQDGFKQPELSIVTAIRYQYEPTHPGFPPDPPRLGPSSPSNAILVHVESWCQDWDPSRQMFSKGAKTTSIERFVGSRLIRDLEIYPIRFFGGGNHGEIESLKRSLEKRGHRWKDLISSSVQHLYHEGPAAEEQSGVVRKDQYVDPYVDPGPTYRHLAQRVVVDSSRRPRGERRPGNPSIRPRMNMGTRQAVRTERRAVEVAHGVPEEHPPSEEFSAPQACLCPSTLQCCAPRTFTWYSVTIDNLMPISFEKEAMKSLVIPKETKTLLLGLIEEHRRTESQGAITDFIANKGESLIIVLHGPPGVGKTLTAETMAEYIEKPLFSISLAQLSDEEQIDERLQKILDYSVSLGGVLLLDEADVVLEARSYENLRRNALVSVFLRMLEYYRGILFLTSNRMKSIDVAFQSRISIGVKFDHMSSDDRMQIWTNFIGRFDSSNRVARDELTRRMEDIKQWPLNGRQIRNILRLAESLAFAEGKRRGALRFKHVERIATETLNFQEIFQEESSSTRSQLARIGNREFQEKRAPQSYRPSGPGESGSHGG